jgi:hypothetical protein
VKTKQAKKSAINPRRFKSFVSVEMPELRKFPQYEKSGNDTPNSTGYDRERDTKQLSNQASLRLPQLGTALEKYLGNAHHSTAHDIWR